MKDSQTEKQTIKQKDRQTNTTNKQTDKRTQQTKLEFQLTGNVNFSPLAFDALFLGGTLYSIPGVAFTPISVLSEIFLNVLFGHRQRTLNTFATGVWVHTIHHHNTVSQPWLKNRRQD